MFFRKKKLIEQDPKTLNIALLSTLQKSLVAKLMLVNDELIRRGESMVELTADMTNGPEFVGVFTDDAAKLRALNDVLRIELARGVDRKPD